MDVVAYARRHNLLDHPDWVSVRDASLTDIPSGTRDVDFEDETELPDPTHLDPTSTIVHPMDSTTAAAKAASANK